LKWEKDLPFGEIKQSKNIIGRVMKVRCDAKDYFVGIGRLVSTGRGRMIDYYVTSTCETVEKGKQLVEEWFKQFSKNEIFYWRANLRRAFLIEYLEPGDIIDDFEFWQELRDSYKYSLEQVSVCAAEHAYAGERLSATLGRECDRRYRHKHKERNRTALSAEPREGEKQ